MKFILSSTVLLKQLNALRGVVPNNPVIPILENFLFDITEETLTITASDLQTSIIATMDIEADGKGSIAVPAKMLIETLRNLPEQPVTIQVDTDDFVIEIISGNGRYKLTGENAEDYPLPNNPSDSTRQLELTADVLASAIAFTLFAASNDEMKPNMNGVFVHINEENATFVATDSHRLVRYRRHDIQTENEVSMILPAKALEQLKSTLPDQNLPVRLDFNDANAFFSFGNVRLICRLIDERFPDYANVIPTENDKKLTLSSAALLGTLKRSIIYANKTSSQIRCSLSTDSLKVSAEDFDFANQANETLPCEYVGEEFEIGFNARFLIDLLTHLQSEQVVLEMSFPNRAALMVPAEKFSEDEDVLMLVMPVMLNNYM
ncbi:MAG: DNA polymerase III subunit beta [Bernardetiaceae bacterium]